MLHHPNVIQAYDFGESDGTLFLVLEYVDGPSLAETVSVLNEAGRQMPVGVACQIAHDVCRALDHVHNLLDADGAPLNVVHRDVTPSNVLLTATGTAKLLDFGVAKYRASQARLQVGTIKGKPAYLAPETLDQRDIDRRTDIFSLGIVLHELLTLQPLFEGDNHQITFYRVLNMEIPAPSAVRPEIPPELDRIVLKALERDRDKRYQTAQDMARDLDAFLAAQAFRSEDAIAFVQELVALIDARQPPESRPSTNCPAAQTRPRRRSQVRPPVDRATPRRRRRFRARARAATSASGSAPHASADSCSAARASESGLRRHRGAFCR